MGVEEEVAVEGGAVALVRRVRGAEGRYSVMSRYFMEAMSILVFDSCL